MMSDSESPNFKKRKTMARTGIRVKTWRIVFGLPVAAKHRVQRSGQQPRQFFVFDVSNGEQVYAPALELRVLGIALINISITRRVATKT